MKFTSILHPTSLRGAVTIPYPPYRSTENQPDRIPRDSAPFLCALSTSWEANQPLPSFNREGGWIRDIQPIDSLVFSAPPKKQICSRGLQCLFSAPSKPLGKRISRFHCSIAKLAGFEISHLFSLQYSLRLSGESGVVSSFTRLGSPVHCSAMNPELFPLLPDWPPGHSLRHPVAFPDPRYILTPRF
jgi:hypothetical protein